MRTQQRAMLALASAVFTCFLTNHAAGQEGPHYSILSVRVGGAGPSLSINNRRMVVGSSVRVDENGEATLFGFALQDRFLDPIDFVESPAVSGHVFVRGNNDRGEIVGMGTFGTSQIGFRYSLGKLESINIPNASFPAIPEDINNSGDVVGWTQILDPFGEPGFLFSGGRVTLFQAPDATRPVAMRPMGINDNRDIVGSYDNRGFLLRNGAYTRIHVPNALSTGPGDINNRGTIVGSYTDAATTHGFVLRNGRFTTIDIPSAVRTAIVSINDSGDIVGIFFDGNRERAFRSNISEFINLN